MLNKSQLSHSVQYSFSWIVFWSARHFPWHDVQCFKSGDTWRKRSTMQVRNLLMWRNFGILLTDCRSCAFMSVVRILWYITGTSSGYRYLCLLTFLSLHTDVIVVRSLLLWIWNTTRLLPNMFPEHNCSLLVSHHLCKWQSRHLYVNHCHDLHDTLA